MLVLLGRPQNLLPEVCLDVHSHPFSYYAHTNHSVYWQDLQLSEVQMHKPVACSMHFLPCSGPPRAELNFCSSPNLLLLGASLKEEAPGTRPGHGPPPSVTGPILQRRPPPHRCSPSTISSGGSRQSPRNNSGPLWPMPPAWLERPFENQVSPLFKPTVDAHCWQDASALLCPHTQHRTLFGRQPT